MANKQTTKRKGTPRRKKKRRGTPVWLSLVLRTLVVMGVATIVYFFFIRPATYQWIPCSHDKVYGVCLPEGSYVHGLDVSHHQGQIDWQQLVRSTEASHPLCFVFIKATEGASFTDECFAYNFAEARRNGLLCGAYHYYKPQIDAALQAQRFIHTVTLQKGDLPPVLDIEENVRDIGQLHTGIRTWLQTVEQHYGIKPIIYCSRKFRKKYLQASFLNDYPFWISNYYVRHIDTALPWTFWQPTNVGEIVGIQGRVDLDLFNGTMEQLRAMTLQ